jgi:hypothetical protein
LIKRQNTIYLTILFHVMKHSEAYKKPADNKPCAILFLNLDFFAYEYVKLLNQNQRNIGF